MTDVQLAAAVDQAMRPRFVYIGVVVATAIWPGVPHVEKRCRYLFRDQYGHDCTIDRDSYRAEILGAT